MRVLVYAQLEGGVKELAAIVIRDVNARRLQVGELAPCLLRWRNRDDLTRFKAVVDFSSISLAFPFGNLPAKRVKIQPINRRREFNQMTWENLNEIFIGFGLDISAVQQCSSAIKDLVEARNDAAHHGAMPRLARELLEAQVRGDVILVEGILTDLALQFIPFFANRQHKR